MFESGLPFRRRRPLLVSHPNRLRSSECGSSESSPHSDSSRQLHPRKCCTKTTEFPRSNVSSISCFGISSFLCSNFREKEELQVFGSQGSFTSKGRRAAGFWIEKDDGNVTEIFQKFKRSFFIDPQTAESFLVSLCWNLRWTDL